MCLTFVREFDDTSFAVRIQQSTFEYKTSTLLGNFASQRPNDRSTTTKNRPIPYMKYNTGARYCIKYRRIHSNEYHKRRNQEWQTVMQNQESNTQRTELLEYSSRVALLSIDSSHRKPSMINSSEHLYWQQTLKNLKERPPHISSKTIGLGSPSSPHSLFIDNYTSKIEDKPQGNSGDRMIEMMLLTQPSSDKEFIQDTKSRNFATKETKRELEAKVIGQESEVKQPCRSLEEISELKMAINPILVSDDHEIHSDGGDSARVNMTESIQHWENEAVSLEADEDSEWSVENTGYRSPIVSLSTVKERMNGSSRDKILSTRTFVQFREKQKSSGFLRRRSSGVPSFLVYQDQVDTQTPTKENRENKGSIGLFREDKENLVPHSVQFNTTVNYIGEELGFEDMSTRSPNYLSLNQQGTHRSPLRDITYPLLTQENLAIHNEQQERKDTKGRKERHLKERKSLDLHEVAGHPRNKKHSHAKRKQQKKPSSKTPKKRKRASFNYKRLESEEDDESDEDYVPSSNSSDSS